MLAHSQEAEIGTENILSSKVIESIDPRAHKECYKMYVEKYANHQDGVYFWKKLQSSKLVYM